MKITVKLQRSNEVKQIEINPNSTVQDVLSKIDIKPDTVIIMRSNKPIPIDDEITDGQELTILQVSSGG